MDFKYWNFAPSVVVGTTLLLAGYAIFVGPLRRRFHWGAPLPGWQRAAFYLGTLCMFLTLIGPLDVLGDESLFSAHMAQHMLLSFISPLLWLFGTPAWLIRRLVPKRTLSVMSNPFFAFTLFNGVMWFWHLPALYDDALAHEGLHIAEHLLFMSSGVIGFLPILKPGLTDGMTPLRKLIYLVPAMFSCTALAALITLSSVQLYSFYGSASLQRGFTPLGDQQLGGLAMWLPGDMLYMALIAWIFRSLLDETAPIEGRQVEL